MLFSMLFIQNSIIIVIPKDPMYQTVEGCIKPPSVVTWNDTI